MSSESGSVSIANKGKASVWTEEAKYELLLRVIHQLKQGRSINWSGIRMKGRNTKSLTNAWTKVNKDIAELEDLEESGGEGLKGTPKKSTPSKRKTPIKPEIEDEGEAVQPDTPVKKRGFFNNMTCSEAKLAWTAEARLQLLLRIVGQLQGKQSIKWNAINMPGRTTKSLQHQWTKIKDMVADLENGKEPKPAKTAVGGKGAAAKRKANDEGSCPTPEATPQKKRQRTRLPDSPIKKEEY